MATSETTNLQLVKYGAGTDNFIRTDYNGNLDKIDTFAGNTNEAIATLNSNSLHFIETVSTISDCNSLTSGCGYTGTSASNSPENYSYVIALNFNGDVFQIALGVTTSNTFIRRYTNNVWTAWKKFSFAT